MTDIRALRSLQEMHQAVDLQRTFWGDNIESVIPAHMLYSLANHGGHVLAAYVEGKMAGVLIGFLGTNEQDTNRPAMANLQIVSKRMVVLPEYRNHGIGYALKLAQRDIAIRQGVRLITWTFDPLLSTNAHLNVRKLGVICQIYLKDYYGTGADSGLSTLGSSDRLLAEWWVTHRRVEERLFGKRASLDLDQYLSAGTIIVNPTTISDDGYVLPAEQTATPSNSLALVEIPLDYPAVVRQNPALALRWRERSRAVFLSVMHEGYIVTDFLRQSFEGRERALYVFSYNGPQVESFTLN